MKTDFLPLRHVPITEDAKEAFDAWVDEIDQQLDDPATDRNELCASLLRDILYPELHGVDPASLSEAARVSLINLDPRNVTLEPEYYQELDPELYYPRKPLIWSTRLLRVFFTSTTSKAT